MNIHFYKYHGAGNDFILVDNRELNIKLNTEQIAFLCHRRFGVGADGLMLLQSVKDADFEMVYFNADGNESTMCGNGGRCIAAFAHRLGITGDTMEFKAIDGMHRAEILQDGTVALHMQDVSAIEFEENFTILNTGSPHFIQWVDDAATIDVFAEGRKIRNRSEFRPKGINVNFVNKTGNGINIRTYERGVEDETLACGTGVTAAAIAVVGKEIGSYAIPVKAMGGMLSVSFDKKSETTAEHIILTGGATFVFEGEVEI
jgi:diaminopimelate epimerase